MEPMKPQSQYSKRKWRVNIKPTKQHKCKMKTTPMQDKHDIAKINTTKQTTPNKIEPMTVTKMKSETKMQTVPKQERTPLSKMWGLNQSLGVK